MIRVVLQELLDARGLTIDKVAGDTGLERSMLNKLSQGRTSIGLHTLDLLCTYLDVEPGDLFKRVPDDGSTPA